MVIEIVLIVLILALTARGWKLGLVEALGELVGAVLAFKVAQYASGWFGAGTTRFIAFVLIALLVAKLVGWLFSMAATMLKIVTSLPLIHLANNILGALFGLLGAIVLVGSTAYIITFYRLSPLLMGYISSSEVARWCMAEFTSVLRFLL